MKNIWMKIGIAIIVLLFCLLICGCLTQPPNRTPRTQSISISQMVDDKVKTELPKALSSIIGDNVINYGPYALAVLISILYGKKYTDLEKLKKKKV